MTKHYLEAYITAEDDPQFRLICEDKEECSKQTDYNGACIFQDQYFYHGIDLIKWEDEETIFGRIEVKTKIIDPFGDMECWITGESKNV